MGARVLAFDLNGRTGWAADAVGSSDQKLPTFGHFVVDEDDDARGFCAARLYHNVQKLVTEFKPDLVAYEAPLNLAAIVSMVMSADKRAAIPTQAKSIRKTYGYGMVLEHVLYDMGQDPPLEVDVNDARRVFLGSRPAKGEGKKMVADRCRALGWQCAGLDESDAACVWDYAHGRMRVRARDAMVQAAARR